MKKISESLGAVALVMLGGVLGLAGDWIFEKMPLPVRFDISRNDISLATTRCDPQASQQEEVYFASCSGIF